MKSYATPLRLLFLFAFVASIVATGCDWNGVRRNVQPNKPPTVRITGGAAEGQSEDYRVEFFWFGSDPDGTVSHFVVAIDDTCMCTYEEVIDDIPVEVKGLTIEECVAAGQELNYEHPDSIWKRVDGFSGQFNFTASTEIFGETNPPLATDDHVFYIKAVDDKGSESRADRRGFDALTIAPTVNILAPRGSGTEQSQQVSTFVTIRWFGRDEDSTTPDKKPVGYQLKMVELSNIFESASTVLSRITNEFICDENTNLLIPDSLVTFEPDSVDEVRFLNCDWYPKPTALYEEQLLQLQNIEGGEYAFAVRAIDQAGSIMPDRIFAIADQEADGNVIKLDVAPDIPVNPHIFVRERNFLGNRNFVATSVWEVQVPVNVPLRFEWDVDASWYGSRVGGINYALDIEDPGCEVCQSPDGVGGWIGWGSHPGIPFDITFSANEAGERHILYVRARDESFSPAREVLAVIQMDVIAFTFDKPALLIDDFRASGLTDCDHDDAIQPMVEYAIEPYLAPGQELEFFNTYQTLGCTEATIPTEIELTTLARYATLYWNVAPLGQPSLLGSVTSNPTFLGTDPREQYLAIYMRAGGNLIVWGRATIPELLGTFYPAGTYDPDIPLFPDPNFGEGTFLWDIFRLRTQFDAVGRGTTPGLAINCSGNIGFRATEVAEAQGFPIGNPDPTGYDPSEVALWIDGYIGHRNTEGGVGESTRGGNSMTSRPPLSVSGLDTLYTFITNSWAWRPADENGVFDPTCESNPDCNHVEGLIDVCGGPFLSLFEDKPAVVRFKDPQGRQGRSVWIGTTLYNFNERHGEDLKQFMRGLTDWVFN
jgi:hypothetical protein